MWKHILLYTFVLFVAVRVYAQRPRRFVFSLLSKEVYYFKFHCSTEYLTDVEHVWRTSTSLFYVYRESIMHFQSGQLVIPADSSFGIHFRWVQSRFSVVGIVTDYGLEDRGVWIRVPLGSRIFSSPRHPDRLWGPPSLLCNGYRVLFPRA
jgi:hypothetical protein